MAATVGEPWRDPSQSPAIPAGTAVPGTLEHFLIERYILYAQASRQLLIGRVHHHPYPLRHVQIDALEETLLAANGLPRPDAPCHAIFSDGVDVDVFPLRPIVRL